MYKAHHNKKQMVRNKARHRALIRLKNENIGKYTRYYFEELNKIWVWKKNEIIQ